MKHSVNRVFLFPLILLIFFGSIGISVFSHFCSIDGTNYSYFIPEKEICKSVESESNCCSENHFNSFQDKAHNKIEKEKCCKEEISYFKLNTENYTKILKLKENAKYHHAFSYFSELFPIIFSREQFIAFSNSSPPIKSGKQIIIQNQVFRI